MTTPARVRRPGRCAGLCTDEGMALAHREHAAVLLGRARRSATDHDAAEDAVQETYLRAWRACGSFDPAGPPLRGWLLAILRNVAIDRARAQARRPRLRSVPPGAPEPAAPGVDVDRVLALRSQLARAMGAISTEHRTVLLKTIIHDRPYGEVATELGIPTGTVKSRVHYALRHLRRVLDTPEVAA